MIAEALQSANISCAHESCHVIQLKPIKTIMPNNSRQSKSRHFAVSFFLGFGDRPFKNIPDSLCRISLQNALKKGSTQLSTSSICGRKGRMHE
jgi:hypothetical protein